MSYLKKILHFAVLWLALLHSAEAGKVTYVYTDLQNTPLVEADTVGNITTSFDYKPYGSQALGVAPIGPGYTGHVNDPDTGLVYMQARYYDSAIGRFLSLDPVGPNGGNPFGFNRYAYTNNNPILGTDPDGRQCAQCLYWPGDSLEHQASINAEASKTALIGSMIVASAVPAIEILGATAAGVAVDTVAHGSLSAGILLNAHGLAMSGGILAELAGVAYGMPPALPVGEGAATEISFASRQTRFSANQISAKLTPAKMAENLTANGYTKKLSQDGSVMVLTKGNQTYTIYPASKSTGGPTASLQLDGERKATTKIRLDGE